MAAEYKTAACVCGGGCGLREPFPDRLFMLSTYPAWIKAASHSLLRVPAELFSLPPLE